VLVFTLAIFSLISNSALLTEPQVILDGGSSYPIEQSVSYRFTCPDGDVAMEVIQKGHDFPILSKLSYAGLPITHAAGGPINNILRQLRALNNVTPRCLTGGGLQMLMTGLKRDKVPSEKLVVGVTIDKEGHVATN
jgi:hypothetical protein